MSKQQRVVAMLLFAPLPRLAVPHVSTCCVSMLLPPCHDSPDSAAQVCCLPQEKLQSPDQQSKAGGFWKLHMCGGEPTGEGKLHWHCKRPKQWVYRPPEQRSEMAHMHIVVVVVVVAVMTVLLPNERWGQQSKHGPINQRVWTFFFLVNGIEMCGFLWLLGVSFMATLKPPLPPQSSPPTVASTQQKDYRACKSKT